MNITNNVLLAPYTTFHLGGPAAEFAPFHTKEELIELLAYAEKNRSPFFVLGGGSNLLIADRGIPALVLHSQIEGIESVEEKNTVRVTVGAGVLWGTFVAHAINNGWWGVENLAGIPGTVGAAPIQNIGAYGVEVAECITQVEMYDPHEKKIKHLTNAQCDFGYRTSVFKNMLAHCIITQVTFTLSRIPSRKLSYLDVQKQFVNTVAPSLEQIQKTILRIRAEKFPDLKHIGTAGSTFKNPIVTKSEHARLFALFPGLPSYPMSTEEIKIPLAYILEKLGWKNYRLRDAGVWHAHALVVVNYGNATASEILKLIEKIKTDVYKRTQLKIETEIICTDTFLLPHVHAS